jgi:hypothetical protein
MLTIASKATPADATSFLIEDLRFAPLHSQEEVTVIGVDAMLNLRPEEDPDRVVVHVDGLAIFGQWCSREGRRREAPPPNKRAIA